ncbi:MAG TPA: bidirectional hydrogenase complex protein HoxU [Opitutaceae bacterium]|jgi:bidirectional [NiFe] hydrogenase diaphorase subunit|nr:bidirectional hydrogenase complex protein HoxU [Opitutaceae bacterium]
MATAAKTLLIDGKPVSAEAGTSLLQAARECGARIPTLCHLEGVDDMGACRLCLVEVKGSAKLLPACTTRVHEGMEVTTDSERLRRYRRMILELLFAERNHVCAVCVANGNCELQTLAYEAGMDHVRFAYTSPAWGVDLTHPTLGMDHNRCILCTRCVRACWDIEGAGTKSVAGRGAQSKIINDLNAPWGESESCTSCGKCVLSCPTGALFHQGVTVGESVRDRAKLEYIVNAREKKQWLVSG